MNILCNPSAPILEYSLRHDRTVVLIEKKQQFFSVEAKKASNCCHVGKHDFDGFVVGSRVQLLRSLLSCAFYLWRIRNQSAPIAQGMSG